MKYHQLIMLLMTSKSVKNNQATCQRQETWFLFLFLFTTNTQNLAQTSYNAPGTTHIVGFPMALMVGNCRRLGKYVWGTHINKMCRVPNPPLGVGLRMCASSRYSKFVLPMWGTYTVFHLMPQRVLKT